MSEDIQKKVIQWFPGHMSKALKVLEEQLEVVDIVVYVIDARAPLSCLNPEFTKRIKNKPIIYVLNKCDLVEDSVLLKIKQKLTQNNSKCVQLNSLLTNSAKILIPEMEKLASSKIEKYALKGINVCVRSVVIGVPNCGKSTLINNLCGKYKAQTGNKAGVTRGKQWVKINNSIEVLDMPGTLWPSFEDSNVALKLAYVGSIKDEVLDKVDLCFNLINYLKKYYIENINSRYNIDASNSDETLSIYEKICESRKYMLKKDEYDYDRCANAVIDDFRKGRLGKVFLENDFKQD